MSLRLVRSPDAPKMTMTQGSAGRPGPVAFAVSSASGIFNSPHLMWRTPPGRAAFTNHRNAFYSPPVFATARTRHASARALQSAAGGAFHVAAEFVAHPRQHLLREGVLLARAE